MAIENSIHSHRKGRYWRDESKECVICGKTFYHQGNAWAEWDKRMGCSRKCAQIYNIRNEPELPSDEVLIREYQEEGLTIALIGARHSVHAIRVNSRLRAILPSYKNQYTTNAIDDEKKPTRERMVELITEQFMSSKQLAAMFEVGLTTVVRWRKEHKIPARHVIEVRRKEPAPTLPDEATLRAEYESGLTMTDLAAKYRVTNPTMSKLFKEYDIYYKKAGFYADRNYVCRDGIEVMSSYELRIGNWLIDHGVDFIYQPKIPRHSAWRADFLATGYYIEIWGMTNSERYDIRKAQKQEWYRSNGIPLLELTGRDVRIKTIFPRILEPCLVGNTKLPKQLSFL